MYTFPDNLVLLIRTYKDDFSLAFLEVLVSEIGQELKIEKKNFLRGLKIFAIICALFVSFGFWSHYLSFLFLSSLSFKIHGFVHEPFEHFCCLT